MNLSEIIDQFLAQSWGLDLLTVAGALLAALVAKGIVAFMRARFAHFAAKTATSVDDVLAELLGRTKFFALLATTYLLTVFLFSLDTTVSGILSSCCLILILLQTGLWASHLVSYLVGQFLHLEDSESIQSSQTAMVFIGKLIVWTLVLILGLDNLGFDIAALVTGLGVSGIAVALAVQNILGDIFASLSIMLDKPFVQGDFIATDDFYCTVENIGLKTTRARSITGEQIIFANSDLLRSRLRNFGRMERRRSTTLLGVTYQTSADQLALVPRILQEIVEKQPQTAFDRAHFKSFGDFSLNFEMVYWIEIPDYQVFMDTNQAVNLEIVRRFSDEGIEFAYPTQTVFLDKDNA